MSRDVAKRPAFESAGELVRPSPVDSRMRRPIATTMGSALVLLRVIAGVAVLVALAAEWDTLVRAELGDTPADAEAAVSLGLIVILALGGAVLAFDLVLAVFIFLGHNWPRIVVMVFSTISISVTFAAWWAGDQEITLDESLLTLALDILIMLALSSRAARAYARRSDPRMVTA